MFTVLVVLFDGIAHSLSATVETTIHDLKNDVYRELLLTPETYILTYAGRELGERTKVLAAGVECGDELHMEMSSLGMALHELKGTTSSTESLVADLLYNEGTLVQAFINTNTEINDQCKVTGETPLTAACRQSNTKATKMLLSAGAKPEMINLQTLQTPLVIAAKIGNLEIAELLLCQFGAGVNTQATGYRNSALYEAAASDNALMTMFLIKCGANINLDNAICETPLYAACLGGNNTIVEILIRNDADVNLTGGYGFTPLFAACQRGDERMVRILIDAGANINRSTGCGQGPLHAAASVGAASVVKILIDNGAEHREDNFGSTPTSEASNNGHFNILNLLQLAHKPTTIIANPFPIIIPATTVSG